MRKTECRSEIQIYRMPRIANEEALARAVDRLLDSSSARPFHLQFDGTAHVDYRAWRRFVRQVWRLGRRSLPIVLSGLDPYCEAIVRFALTTRDWELFTETASGSEAGASRGNGAAARSDGSGSALAAASWGSGLFLEPCPN